MSSSLDNNFSYQTPNRPHANDEIDHKIDTNNSEVIRESLSKLKTLSLSDSPAGVEEILNNSVDSTGSVILTTKLPSSSLAEGNSDDLPLSKLDDEMGKGGSSLITDTNNVSDIHRDIPNLLSEHRM